MNDFETWWYHEGSAPPLPGEDGEEHCKRMCKIAWSNGAFKEQEACATLCENMALEWGDQPAIAQVELATILDCALAIRNRSEA
jgi:hypothetical protein